MSANLRIEELRRRVDKDPASIAFAQLAEEYRRTGQYEESVRVARAGLTQHPGFVSARVTLGLSLIELGQHEEARATLEGVVQASPDNQTASRALAEISQRLAGAVTASVPLPAHSPDIRGTGPANHLRQGYGGPPKPCAEAEAGHYVQDTATYTPVESLNIRGPVRSAVDPALHELETWLAAIKADRAVREHQS